MSIELPKDADGRDIPLDVDALYDKNGERLTIYAWEYMPKLKHSKWRVLFLFDESGVKYYPDDYYLTPPDSWEKLEEDLERALSTPGPDTYASITCGYFDSANVNCSVCEYMHGIKNETCNDDAWRDIASRIRKLKGDE